MAFFGRGGKKNGVKAGRGVLGWRCFFHTRLKFAGGAESAGAAFGVAGEFLDGAELELCGGGKDELADSFAGGDFVGIFAAVLEGGADFIAVVRIDNADGIGEDDAEFDAQSGAGGEQSHKSGGDGDGDSGADGECFAGLECGGFVDAGAQIDSGGAVGGVLREGKIASDSVVEESRFDFRVVHGLHFTRCGGGKKAGDVVLSVFRGFGVGRAKFCGGFRGLSLSGGFVGFSASWRKLARVGGNWRKSPLPSPPLETHSHALAWE